MNKAEIQEVLNSAQQLLWGGSETENIAAHNMIAKLIVDLEGDRHVDTSDIVWYHWSKPYYRKDPQMGARTNFTIVTTEDPNQNINLYY